MEFSLGCSEPAAAILVTSPLLSVPDGAAVGSAETTPWALKPARGMEIIINIKVQVQSAHLRT